MGQEHPVQEKTLIERVARYLASRPGASAAAAADDWPAHLDDASSLLALIQEPDAAMAESGDVSVWIAMIDAALRERWTLAQAMDAPAAHPSAPHPPEGHDEEGEAPVAPEDMRRDDAAWAGISEKEKSA